MEALFLISANQIVLDIDFEVNKSGRDKVVSKVQDGTIKPTITYHSSLIHLPDGYDQLSAGDGDFKQIEKIEENWYLIASF